MYTGHADRIETWHTSAVGGRRCDNAYYLYSCIHGNKYLDIRDDRNGRTKSMRAPVLTAPTRIVIQIEDYVVLLSQ